MGGGVQILKNLHIYKHKTNKNTSEKRIEDKKTGKHACAKGGLIRY